MTTSFTKLFQSILQSTIWVEPLETRVLWITMLALADRRGRVHGSIPGLAHTADIPLDKCEQALNRFLSPDVYSRSTEQEGRRIEKIDGGWQLINYDKYRELRDEETTREVKRAYMRRARNQAKQNVTIRANNVTVTEQNSGKINPQWIQAEAEAEAVHPPQLKENLE